MVPGLGGGMSSEMGVGGGMTPGIDMGPGMSSMRQMGVGMTGGRDLLHRSGFSHPLKSCAYTKS